jgi:hypothetical protein
LAALAQRVLSKARPSERVTSRHGASAGADKNASPHSTAVTVRGGYVNDNACEPIAVAPTDDPTVIRVECLGGSIWNGAFTGHTVIHLRATIAASGAMAGEYDEMLIGTYLGDNSHGALHTKGTFTINEIGEFAASASITGGSCDWAGSSGSMTYTGYQLNGGYVGEWVRPAVPPASDPTCNPIDRLPR